MKLPELLDCDVEDALHDGELSIAQLAQLHCLRSIAVNLEVIATYLGQGVCEGLGVPIEDQVRLGSFIVNHSVMEVPDGDAE